MATIVSINDLDRASFPVLDIVKEDGSRLGCCSVAMTNFIMKLGTFDKEKFSCVSDMSLYFEAQFKAEGDEQRKSHCFKVVDEFLNQNKGKIEFWIYRADGLSLGTILTFLSKGFTFLSFTETDTEGHSDVFFRNDDGRVFYNSVEVNMDELCAIIYSHPLNMFCVARPILENKRFMVRSEEIAKTVVMLSDVERQYLQSHEIFYLTHDLLAKADDFPNMKLEDLILEKFYLLRSLGLIDVEFIYPLQILK